MASIISAGTTSGTALNFSGDTSGVLQLATNGTTTAITVDTSQNVGIGTASPVGKLSIYGTGALATFQNATTGSTGSDGSYIALSGNDLQISNKEASANMIFYTVDTERMRIDSAGDLLINQTAVILTGTIQFTFDGANEQGMCIKNSANSANGAALRFIDYTNAHTGGGIYFSSSNSINYATSSDYRLKENIAPMTGALTKIQQLKPVTFSWKQDNSVSQGFIAHELQAVIPEAVNGTKDAVDKDGNPRYQGVDTSYIVATLTAAIQELKAINDTQAATITALTARIVALETV